MALAVGEVAGGRLCALLLREKTAVESLWARVRQAAAVAMFGLDLGDHTSVLASVVGTGADTVPNAIGSRATPTVVSYGSRQRYVGEDAAAQRVTNAANTIEGLPSLLGRRAWHGAGGPTPATTDLGGDGVRVSYGGSDATLANEAVVGAYMAGMVQLARNVHPVAGQDPMLVLAVPSYYTAVQRHALAHAGAIAGGQIAHLCDETVATALFYAHDRLKDAAQHSSQAVLFVDAGHCHTTAFVVHYDHAAGALRVVDSETVLVGGRDFVTLLAQKFERDVQEQKSVEITSERAKLRLLSEAEKAKKVLSANSSWSAVLEELQDGLDFAATASRDEFTQLCDAAGLLTRLAEGVTALLLRVLTSGSTRGAPIGAVELFGGSARVPAVSSTIMGAVAGIEGLNGLAEGRSLNGAESVARGAALYGASMQPGGHGRLMRVQHCAARNASLTLDVLSEGQPSSDGQPEAGSPAAMDCSTASSTTTETTGHSSGGNGDCSMYADDSMLVDLPSVPTAEVALPSVPATGKDASGVRPASVVLGLNRGQPLPYVFGAEDGLAVDPAACVQGLVRVVLTTEEDGDCARPAADGSSSAMTVMLFLLELTNAGEAAMNSGEAGVSTSWPLQLALVGNDGTMKVLQPSSRGGEPLLRLSPLAPSSLPRQQQQPLLTAAQLEVLVNQERAMQEADLEVGKAMEAHDQLERYVYQLRDFVRLYGTEEESANSLPELERTEDWLYNEGSATDNPAEDVTSGDLLVMYEHKTAAIAQMCAPSTQRAKVWSDRRESLRQLLDVLEMLRTVALDPQAAARFHLNTKQTVAVGKSVSEAEKWLSDHGLPSASWDSALSSEPRSSAAAVEAAASPEIVGMLGTLRTDLEKRFPDVMEGERARGIAAATELLTADKAVAPGTRIHVDGHGEGVYVSFESKWIGANEHTLDFRAGEAGGGNVARKMLKLRDLGWKVVAPATTD